MISNAQQKFLTIFNLNSIKDIALFISIFCVLFFANFTQAISLNLINSFSSEVIKVDAAVAVVGRKFTHDERQLISDVGRIQSQTHLFMLNIKHEVDGDFRVATAKVIATSKDYPISDWIKDGQNLTLATGEALISPIFALELGLKIGDRFKMASGEYVYAGELIGQPAGSFINGLMPPNVLLNDLNSIENFKAADPNYLNTLYIKALEDTDSLEEYLRNNMSPLDVSFQKKGLHNIQSEHLVRDLQLLPEIIMALVLICSTLLLYVGIGWAQLGFTQPIQKLSMDHPLWKLVILLIIASISVFCISTFLQVYFGTTVSTFAFVVSFIYFLFIVLIVFIDVYFKPVMKSKAYSWACQFLLIMGLFLLQTQFSTSLLVPYITFVSFIIIAIFFDTKMSFPDGLKEYLTGRRLTGIAVICLCSVTIGFLIHGANQLSQRKIGSPLLTVSDLSEKGLEQISSIFELEGLAAPSPKKLIIGQISAVNGHAIKSNFAVPQENILWMTVADRAEPHLVIENGDWWDAFSIENYIAMEESFAQNLGLKIGDQIKLFVNGSETIAILGATFTAQNNIGGKFAKIYASSNILNAFPSTHYVTLDIEKADLKAIVQKISAQIPEAMLHSNKSDIWANQLIQGKVDIWLSKFSSALASVVLFLAFVAGFLLPKIDYFPKWCKDRLIRQDYMKQLGFVVLSAIGFYIASMMILMLIIYFGFGAHVGGSTMQLNQNVWLGVGLFTLIIFTFVAIVQYFREVYMERYK